jgi:hypothetical protein
MAATPTKKWPNIGFKYAAQPAMKKIANPVLAPNTENRVDFRTKLRNAM